MDSVIGITGMRTHRPMIDFMIIGTRKGGTNALHRFLRQHPEFGMPVRKEAHLFDSTECSSDGAPEQIGERYRSFFERHDPVLRRVFGFPGVSEDVRIAPWHYTEKRTFGAMF